MNSVFIIALHLSFLISAFANDASAQIIGDQQCVDSGYVKKVAVHPGNNPDYKSNPDYNKWGIAEKEATTDIQLLIDSDLISINTEANGHGWDYGAGSVEAYFTEALINMNDILKFALELDSINTKQKQLVTDIIKSLPLELKAKPLLAFSQGDSFIIGGTPKIAYTALGEVGSTIFINRNMLYAVINGAKIVPGISKQMALQVLIHELGHHQGEEDHSLLDDLGAIIAKAWTTKSSISIRNSSFEEVDNYGWPLHWQATKSDIRNADIVVQNFLPGKDKFALELSGKQADSLARVLQCVSVPHNKNVTSAAISGLVLPSFKAGGEGNITVYVFAGETAESFTDGKRFNIFGNEKYINTIQRGKENNYKLLRYDFPLSDKADKICVQLIANGMGKMWVDEVDVEFF